MNDISVANINDTYIARQVSNVIFVIIGASMAKAKECGGLANPTWAKACARSPLCAKIKRCTQNGSIGVYCIRGEAQAGLGQSKEAAHSYLDSFTVQPNGPFAARALTNVGLMLGQLGQVVEACRTLNEVVLRYPSDEALGSAQTGMQSLGCS